ncbi:prostaglandin E synthase isoform X1 [Syngnathus typhle]|uniref:prostaglandin E synthase isoform X1 n=1 Tax=Syngnathus typhle TaxID=161592 RepID=UPI002A6B20E3|nr:prostaglandin E synthase isoform X1 [Syngnathus typhle]
MDGWNERFADVWTNGHVSECSICPGTFLTLVFFCCKWKAFANPEDAMRHGGAQYHRLDPDVERCRRAHRNDMENIFPFLFLGAIYSMTGPSLATARLHFVAFTAARVLHSVAYLAALPAPTRSLAYVAAQVPCLSMALQILAAVGAYA